MKKQENNTSADRVPATGNSPGSAIPIGAEAKIPIIPGYGPGPRVGDLLVSILEVKRGEEVESYILSRGIEIKSLQSGFENVLLRVKVEYARAGRGPREQPYYLPQDHFIACSADGGTEYRVFPYTDQPQESLIGHMFTQGDSREGWILCQLPENEERPFLLFRRENADNVWGLWSDIWFKLF